MIKKDLNTYCKENFIPEPYKYCNHILNKIDQLLTENKDSLEEIWGWINRNLINIFVIFINPKLISDKEFDKLKKKLIDIGIKNDKIYHYDVSLENVFKLIMYRGKCYRINSIINEKNFFKDIPLKNLHWYNNPFESKWYINIMNEDLIWKNE